MLMRGYLIVGSAIWPPSDPRRQHCYKVFIIPITFSRWELNPISTLSHKYCDIGLFTFKCFEFVEISRNVIGRKCASRTKVKQFVVNIARNGNNPFLRCVEMEAEGALDEQKKWSWELGFCPRSSRKSIQRIKISHYSMNFMLRIFIQKEKSVIGLNHPYVLPRPHGK